MKTPPAIPWRATTSVPSAYTSATRRTGRPCQAIVTVGSYSNVARFVRHACQQGETWVVSAISGTGADDYPPDLEEYGVTDKIVMTHVVPLLHSDLPIVREARQARLLDPKNPLHSIIDQSGVWIGREAVTTAKEILRG